MFYKVDSARVSLREYWWECRAPWMWPVFVIGALLKFLRIRLPSSVDDVTVEEIAPFRVRENVLEPEVLNKLLPRETALADLGFHSPVYHAIDDSFQRTAYRISTLQHDSERVFAQIRFRLWSRPKPAKESLFISLVTAFRDGTYLITTSARRDLSPPPECEVQYHTGADVEELWSAHQAALDSDLKMRQVRLVDSQAALLSTVEALHRSHRDFHVRRGVFVPLSPLEVTKAAKTPAATTLLGDVDDDAFLKELQTQESGGGSWRQRILILAVSLVLFISAGMFAWSRAFAVAIIPVLFFHELGHYVAMRLFGYRNLKMFFIPFFGAAVSGQSYNVDGWKKAIVSLMGPLPGIFVGIVLGVIALVIGRNGGIGFLDQKTLLAASLLLLGINALNLLPLLPLDGGWIVHALVFSRHPLSDVVFRVGTVTLLFGLFALSQQRLWMYLGIATLVSIPWAYRIAKIAKKIRAKGIAAISEDGQTIDRDVAVQILHEIRATSPAGIKPKQGAQITLQVFDALNTRPPSIAASLLIGMVHFGAFVSAVVFAAVFVIAQSANLGDFMLAAAAAPTVPLDVSDIQQSTGPQAAEKVKVLIGRCETPAQARQVYEQRSVALVPTATLTRFGDYVLLAIPSDDDQLREQLFTQLERNCNQTFVAQQEGFPWLRISCLAPSDEVAAQLEEDCKLYFRLPREAFLVPPWSPKSSDLTAEQRNARRTYQLLTDQLSQVESPEYMEASKRFARANRRGDSAAAKDAQAEMEKAAEMQRKHHIQRVQSEHRDIIRKEVVDLLAAQPKWSFDEEESLPDNANEQVKLEQKKMAVWYAQLGGLMGQLPMQGDQPATGELRLSGTSGGCNRVGLLLTFQFLSFERLDYGAPALVQWLSQRGCSTFKYSVDAGLGDLGGEDDVE